MFKDKLKKLREQSNLTLEELSKKTRIPSKDILSWENGDSLPNMKQVKKLADVFYVDKEKLLDKDSYLDIVMNSEEPYSKKRRITIVAVSIVAAVIIGSIYSGNYSQTFHYHDQSFFKSFMLKEYGVEGIKEQDDTYNSEYLTYEDKYNYCANIDNRELFEEYAEYVFTYLLQSPNVYNLCFLIEKRTSETEFKSDSYFTYFLVSSNDLSDYISYNSICGNHLSYSFYYFVDSPETIDKNEKDNIKRLNLSYSEDELGIAISRTNDPDCPNISMAFSTHDVEDNYEYYFASAYYSIKEEYVTNDNYQEYFSYSFRNDKYGIDFILDFGDNFSRNSLQFEVDYVLTSSTNGLSTEFLTYYIDYSGFPDFVHSFYCTFENFETYNYNTFIGIENTRVELTNTAKVFVCEPLTTQM